MSMMFLMTPRDLLTLIKVRITAFITLTAIAGYGLSPMFEWNATFGVMTLGVFLITAGASAVNMFLERNTDALMDRTKKRPLPAQILTPRAALAIGMTFSIAGFVALLTVGVWPAGIAVVSWIFYVLIYTPLKAKTSLNTVVGAIPGALPPLIGWTATGAPLSMLAFVPFLLMFVWQIPHFLALAWMYRDDYAQGGLQMLTVQDREGGMVGRQALLYAICLIPISAAPILSEGSSIAGTLLAVLLSSIFVAYAARFAKERNRNTASSLFRVSLLYLPCAFGLMFLSF